jgi:hypothetical protein
MSPFLKPGTAVRLVGADDGRPEYGIVVHCWFNEEVHAHDCAVAFFGGALPSGTPEEPPYILRYLSTSLTVLSGPSARPNDAEIDAAARVLDREGRDHGWWPASIATYDELDPIGKDEFGAIVERMLIAAAQAR